MRHELSVYLTQSDNFVIYLFHNHSPANTPLVVYYIYTTQYTLSPNNISKTLESAVTLLDPPCLDLPTKYIGTQSL